MRVSSRRRTKLPRLLGALTHKRFADVRWGSIATFPVGNVANEQIQAVGKLIEVAVSQPMGWQRAGADVIRLGAGVVRFLVSAVVKLPIGFQLRARWAPGEIFADRGPGRTAMPVHVIFSDLVRNPLKAEAVDQPVIQRRGISPVDCDT